MLFDCIIVLYYPREEQPCLRIAINSSCCMEQYDVAENHPKRSIIKGTSIGMTTFSNLALFFDLHQSSTSPMVNPLNHLQQLLDRS